ncbi:MAG: EAL domain-containing protein [Gammaproteobacteria bacterium]|nr:EAL domain-containing protein [Gammaproteobacteria bacterium]
MKPPWSLGIPAWLSYGALSFLSTYGALWAALALGVAHPPIWIATGLTLAGLLLHGNLLLPGIYIGSFAAWYLNGHAPLAGGIAALLSTAGVVVASYLLKLSGPYHDILLAGKRAVLLLLAAILVTPLFTTLSWLALDLVKGIPAVESLFDRATGWWLSDTVGVLVVTPLMLAWFGHTGTREQARWFEGLCLAVTTLAVGYVLLGVGAPILVKDAFGHYVAFPVIVWAALRFQGRALSLVLLTLVTCVTLGDLLGYSPFPLASSQHSETAVQLYLAVLAATALMVNALVSEKRLELEKLALANKIIAHSPEGIIITDPGGIILSANPAFFESTGFHPNEITGGSIRRLTSVHHSNDFFTSIWRQLRLNGHWEGEIWNRNRDGEILPQWLSLTAISDRDQQPSHYLGIYSNVSRHKQVQERMRRLAYYDVLTNLPNRQLFSDRLNQALKYARRNSSRLALFFIDLDRFKNINDTLGHSVGDKVLQLTAERLSRCIRQTDTLARLGGDEFTIIIQDLNEDYNSILVAEKTVRAFQSPILVEDHELFLTPSIGVALFPDDANSAEELLKFADTAMYRAKELGGNGFQFFASDMSDPIRWNLTMENALRRAIEQDGISLVYQPQFDLRTGNIVGLEALARWHHKGLEETPPEVFIKVAEETGLIHRLGERIMRLACLQAAHWQQEGFKQLKVSVNISLLQLKQGDFAQRLQEIITETGAPLELIELEITESTLMENAGFMENIINMLSVQGFNISIDDFGTGYSSLSYLKRLSINRIKIDGSFINDLPNDPNDAAICSAIISMAHNLELNVIAEGVETDEQMEFLRKEHCDEIQGYVYSRPISPQEVSEMIHQGYWHTDG